MMVFCNVPMPPESAKVVGRPKRIKRSPEESLAYVQEKMRDKTGLTQERLKALLHYAPETGAFTWKVSTAHRVRVGDTAGGLHAIDGYWRIMVDGHPYKASRLAWLYMTGEFPLTYIDHDNRIKSDDSWENLRQATPLENNRNCSVRKDNTSGLRGVSWEKISQKWKAQISVAGKKVSLGLHPTKELAHAAYLACASEHFGEFMGATKA